MSEGAHLAIVAGFWTIVVVALVLLAVIRRRRAAAAAERSQAADLSATTKHARKRK
jgi:hypothetical protein